MAIGLIVDGRSYNVHVVPDSVKRIAELLEGPLADDMLSGRRERDLKGTRIGYQLHIEPVWTDPTDYDALFDALSDPVDAHTLVLPYGQTTITFEAMVDRVEDTLIGKANGVNRWHGLILTITPQSPQKEA